MAISLDELTTMRDALTRARMNGVLRVRDQNGEELLYKSDSDMARALANIESQIAALQGAEINTIKFQCNNGT